MMQKCDTAKFTQRTDDTKLLVESCKIEKKALKSKLNLECIEKEIGYKDAKKDIMNKQQQFIDALNKDWRNNHKFALDSLDIKLREEYERDLKYNTEYQIEVCFNQTEKMKKQYDF